MARRPKATQSQRRSKAKSGFTNIALHVTEEAGGKAFKALAAERPRFAAFALPNAQPLNLNPESAAKRILLQALESKAVPSLVAPKIGDTESEFKSLGVETIPLTGTTVVKFRQQVKGVPVYGSLVSVELGEGNECISLNSNLGTPDVKSSVAKISPQDALRTAGSAAGYGKQVPDATPTLTYYLDAKGKWHLAYLIADIRLRKAPKSKRGMAHENQFPLVFDYVVDAINGSLVAELPRTPSVAAGAEQADDELGNRQTVRFDTDAGKKVLRDTIFNIETYDFGWRDPERENAKLPGKIVGSPPSWASAAVSAHANAASVASFLRDVLRRNNIDDRGGRLVSSVNCLVRREEEPPGSRVWLNAFWDPSLKQMVYGQARFNGKLRSLASALDVVAHELFHGITDHTARLEYALESGALNESYSDIFGVIISNLSTRSIDKWNWLMGDGISSGLAAFRDFQNPTKFQQPKHMRDFVHLPNTSRGDYGGVHTNSGIHNFAAYGVMTARDRSGKLVFKPAELAAIFYIALTQHLSRQSKFVDSRRGVVLATRSFFRSLPPADLTVRVAAVETGFDAAGIH